MAELRIVPQIVSSASVTEGCSSADTFLRTSLDSWAIDNRMKIVGDYSDAGGFVHGYTWTETDAIRI